MFNKLVKDFAEVCKALHSLVLQLMRNRCKVDSSQHVKCSRLLALQTFACSKAEMFTALKQSQFVHLAFMCWASMM